MTTQELKGISHELRFWQDFVKTKRFLNGWVAQIPTPELNDIVKQFIHYNTPANGFVLDVGSGVCSILNGLRHDLQITACDPLGDLYALIFDYNLHRKVSKPLAIPAEEIDMQGFNLVHCSNALDHTQDPAKAYIAMENAVKKGGYLIIQGFENEAVHEDWQGFHQWNLKCNGFGQLVMSAKDNEEIVIDKADTFHRIQLETGKHWFIFIKQKK